MCKDVESRPLVGALSRLRQAWPRDNSLSPVIPLSPPHILNRPQKKSRIKPNSVDNNKTIDSVSE